MFRNYLCCFFTTRTMEMGIFTRQLSSWLQSASEWNVDVAVKCKNAMEQTLSCSESLSFVFGWMCSILWAPSRHDRHLLNIFCVAFFTRERGKNSSNFSFFLLSETNNAVRFRSSVGRWSDEIQFQKWIMDPAISIIEIAHCRLILLISSESFRRSSARSSTLCSIGRSRQRARRVDYDEAI